MAGGVDAVGIAALWRTMPLKSNDPNEAIGSRRLDAAAARRGAAAAGRSTTGPNLYCQ